MAAELSCLVEGEEGVGGEIVLELVKEGAENVNPTVA
jgi:hypothetical protein